MRHTGAAWEEGRKRTLQRDDHRCQDCASEEELHVHHIKRPREFDDRDAAHHPSNLVTLCKYCHKSWEGVEARPILLDDQGTNLKPLIEDMVVDHITRLSHRSASRQIYTYFLRKNPSVCQFCYRPDGAYSIAPAEHWRACVRMVVKLGFGELTEAKIPIQRDGLGKPVELTFTTWVCEECHGVRDTNAIKTGEFVRLCFWASEALAAQGILHDTSRLADMGRELKTTMRRTHHEVGIMIDAVSAAVEAVKGDERLPDWLHEERY